MSINNYKIGCIGTGNMGNAILSGLAKSISKENIFCFDVDRIKLQSVKANLGIQTAESLENLSKACDILIIAVKPDIVHSVLKEIRGNVKNKIIISIAAGIKTDAIENLLDSSAKVIRVMPNTPALIAEGMSALSQGSNADEESMKTAEDIFSLIGKTVVLPEKQMDAVTAVSGSGPAYVFTFIQALTDGGVKMGLPRDKAAILAAQTVIGAARMVLEGSEDPISLRGKVTSPGGTTIEAVHILEKAGFSGIVMDAVEAAKIKSEKLGK